MTNELLCRKARCLLPQVLHSMPSRRRSHVADQKPVTVEIRELPADPGHVMHSPPSAAVLPGMRTAMSSRAREAFFRSSR